MAQRIISKVAETVRRRVIPAAVAAVLGIMLAGLPVAAQDKAPTPDRVNELLKLLADPGVQSWLKEHGGQPGQPASAPAPAPAPSAEGSEPSRFAAERLAFLHRHLRDLVMAVPTLPQQLADAAAALAGAFAEAGWGQALLLVLLLAAGFALDALFRRMTAPWWRGAAPQAAATPAARLRRIGLNLGYGLGAVLAFVIGNAVFFLAGDWPPALRETILAFLLAYIVFRVVRVLCHTLLVPEDTGLAMLPVGPEVATYWLRRVSLMVGWFLFGWAIAATLSRLGLSLPARQLVAYALGSGLLVMAWDAAWRRPRPGASGAGGADAVAAPRRRVADAAFSLYAALLWLTWVSGMYNIFWLVAFAFLLPAAIILSQRAIRHVMRPAEGAAGDATGGMPATISMVLVERGTRALLIVATVFLLAIAWHIDMTGMMGTDTVGARLVRGVLTGVVLLLVGDVVWRLIRTMIDSKIAASSTTTLPDTEESRRRARIRTLLPILKNFLFVVLIVVVGLMVLSSMGVQIAPLIAGAGVVGVAVGFGAQTLVKDVISGVFYLLDDAFRVGEYIQSGNYKGTVESFSLRSVKLRHHRGPVYTVPFGSLGAVENMSRDWVIDKLTVGVTYDSDLDKARKLIKQIGKDLAENPDYKTNIISPLKMQGVDQFGDFAIQLRMKMTCRPGEQFVIRRKALAMIKQAFDANGIKFASPTVRVSGGEEAEAAAAAAAQQTLATSKAAEGA